MSDELGVAPDGMPCAHPAEGMQLGATFKRVVPEGAGKPVLMLDLTATCTACSLPFRFLVPDVGVAWLRPATNVPGTEMNVQIVPLTETDIQTGLVPHLVRHARQGDPDDILRGLANVLENPSAFAQRAIDIRSGQLEPREVFWARAVMAALPGITWEGV